MNPRKEPSIDILMVSESPERIVEAQASVKPFAIRLVGCFGPAQAPCYITTRERCPLAGNAKVILVDVPPSGRFRRNWYDIGASVYAEKLADAHPGHLVILCGATEGSAGPTGNVTTWHQDALSMVESLGALMTRSLNGSAA